MKCLPSASNTLLAANHVLHDWHAEIVAIRAFNHFLLEEARLLALNPDYDSTILRTWTPSDCQDAMQQPFAIRDDARIVMYCSEAPCGDASMELVMEAQEDATPWPVTSNDDGTLSQLLGRGFFSQLGIVRRKPCESLFQTQ